MYSSTYFILFYMCASIGTLLVVFFLYFLGVFRSEDKKEETTLSILTDRIKTSNQDKEILDSVMRDFYANHYRINKTSEDFEQWINLIKSITMIDYMSVEQVARFRDDLINKNPSSKQEIIYAIGTSLKYREEQSKNG